MDDFSIDGDIISDMTTEEFAGHFAAIHSDDNLASSGDDLDGSTLGSVMVAFEDPELIALQPAAVVGGNVNSAGHLAATGDLTASVFGDGASGSAGGFVPSTPPADDLPSNFFLDDGSKKSPGPTPSAEITSTAGSGGDEPLYNIFFDDTSNTGAGEFTALTAPEQPLTDPNNYASEPTLTFPNLASAGTEINDASLFYTNDDKGTAGTAPTPDPQIAESNRQGEGAESYSLLPATTGDLFGTSSISTSATSPEPNLFTTEGTDSSNLASLPAAADSNTDLFADSLSAGSDLISSSSSTARKIRRQEVAKPYPGPGGWRKPKLVRRR
jgi:hypothetical protein